MEKPKKRMVTFNENINSWYYYEQVNTEQQLSWTQIALDEMRFRNKLGLVLETKMKHLLSCNKPCHDACTFDKR